MAIKKANYAGSWYPSNSDTLKKELDSHFNDKEFGPGKQPDCLNQEERHIIGGVSGHAGISFSGPASAFTYLKLFQEKIPDTIIVLGFHHRESWGNVFLTEGEWETPLGNLEIDSELSQELSSICKVLKPNEEAFLRSTENSVELQMPFIKYCAGENDVKILPIKIQSHNYLELENIADEISRIINSSNKDVIIVASSDMSHYNVHEKDQLQVLKEIDQGVINQFLDLNAENVLDPSRFTDKKLYNQFDNPRPSVCGTHTMATLILTCKKLNASKAKFLKYYHSKNISSSGGAWTVGYFSGIILK
ncbi:MAG: AmmeMemoRadiSam system protein B [Promethearchaeota archaeon]|jgi:AmmeMemoRadiSam system protein B